MWNHVRWNCVRSQSHNENVMWICQVSCRIEQWPKILVISCIWGILPPNNLRNLVMNQSEEWNVIRVLKFWTLLNGVLNCYYSHGTKKNHWNLGPFTWGQCSRQKVQGQLAATFFFGGVLFFFGVGCDEGFWNNMLVSSYVLLLFSAPMFFWVLRAGNCARIWNDVLRRFFPFRCGR